MTYLLCCRKRGIEMQMNSKSHKRIMAVLLSAIIVLSSFSTPVFAEEGKTEVDGRIYTFDKKSDYEFSASDDYKSTEAADTYGVFSVSGNITNISNKDGVPAYEIANGNLKLFYTYTDSILKAEEKSWHLIDDKGKTIDDKKLSEKIMKGAIILQTSKDRKNWVDVSCNTDVFNKTPIKTDEYYTTKDVELLNGCFYRMIVAYETRKMVEPNKILFVTVNEYEYKKTAEIYEFYAVATNNAVADSTDEKHNLGEKVRTEKFDGYSGEKEITKKDAHYGWELGNFFVSGYTDKVQNTEGEMVFLKNVGDKVTLWFNLKQNIDALDGKDNLKISADNEGFDAYFETPTMDLGKGALFIRYTDSDGIKHEPIKYLNYLEANTSVGADTMVQLFEEGDYEVALDYEVTNDKLIDSVSHYRIFFKFSVRNGNCMIYLFDLENGNELTNSSVAENGFRLDYANSQYLNVTVKREILTESADGLVEDTRSNAPAKDGAEYTEDGIYTITVKNNYTNQSTTKKIYVGQNTVLKAHMTTGLTIPEINELISKGATIADDGTITLVNLSTSTDTGNDDKEQQTDKGTTTKIPNYLIVIIAFIVLGTTVIAYVIRKKHKANPIETNDKGGTV